MVGDLTLTMPKKKNAFLFNLLQEMAATLETIETLVYC